MTLRKRKGQSTLEYVLLVTAVIVVIIGLVVSPQSPFRTKLNSTISGSMDSMDYMGARLANSRNGI
jgi:hypothetical protein